MVGRRHAPLPTRPDCSQDMSIHRTALRTSQQKASTANQKQHYSADDEYRSGVLPRSPNCVHRRKFLNDAVSSRTPYWYAWDSLIHKSDTFQCQSPQQYRKERVQT